MASKYKLNTIIFDFDGTIVDSTNIKTEAFAFLYKDHKPDIVKQVINYHIQNQGLSRYEKFKYFQSILLKKKYSKKIESKLDKEFSSYVFERVVKSNYIEGAKEFLYQYHKILNFYLISATPDAELKKIIELKKIKHYFKEIYGSPIDKGQAILKILKDNNIENNKTLVIGDSLSDLEGAKKANVSFLAISLELNSNIFKKEVKCINNFNNLIDYLKY